MNTDSTTDEQIVRPIDANALILLIDKDKALWPGDVFTKNYGIRIGLGRVQEGLRREADTPTLDYQPVKRGHWISHGKNSPFTCSCCGSGCLLNYESDWHESDFCPHCGAKMNKENETCFVQD